MSDSRGCEERVPRREEPYTANCKRINRPNVARGTLTVTKARVAGIDKDSTKTDEDRRVELCPRALDVLNRHLALRKRLQLARNINHDHLFFKEIGEPIRRLPGG